MHYEQVEEIIRYLEYIENRAAYYSDTVTIIISDNPVNDIAKRFITFSNDGYEPVTAWNRAVNKSKMLFTAKEKELIIDFFKDICSSSKETLEEKNNRSISELINIQNQLMNEKDKKTKLSSATIISFGLFVVLILI